MVSSSIDVFVRGVNWKQAAGSDYSYDWNAYSFYWTLACNDGYQATYTAGLLDPVSVAGCSVSATV